MDKPRKFRSLLWPVLLIGVGVVWLLYSLGIIQAASFNALVSLWPLILIVIGLDMLFGRRSPVASVLIALLALAAVVFVLLAAPALNLPTSAVMQTQTIVEPRGEATSADISLDLSSMPTRLYALGDSRDLLRAEIDYFGTLDYQATGESVRRISISQRTDSSGLRFVFDPSARWEIGLSPAVPIDLSIDGASGSAEIDLTGLDLSSFWFDQGSGSFDVILPMSPKEYEVTAIGGSGSLEITLPEQTSLTLRLDGQSGSIRVNLPDRAGVRLEVLDSGSGSVNFPRELDLVSGGEDKEGVWESPGYDDAVYKLRIICEDLGSGSFSLR
jgi:hypothetical protein